MKLKVETNTPKGLFLHIIIVLAVVVLGSFIFFYRFLPFVTNKNQVVTVPDVKGMSLEDAATFLEGKDLDFEVSDSSYDAQSLPLTVLEQFPKSLEKVKVH